MLHYNLDACSDTGGKSVELMRYLETIARLCSTEKVAQYVASSGSMKLVSQVQSEHVGINL